MKSLFLVCAFAFVSISLIEGKKHKLVAYWGQNAVYNLKKEKQYFEKDLSHFCRHSNYDVIVLAFMHVFFDARQKDSMPGMNFAFHCETPLSQEYPFLLRCPKIEAGIKECQARGKQVLLSLGGATGGYGFKNDAEAKLFAQRVWDLVLGGDKLKTIRPFGSAVLDGVDLDIEGGSHIGYTQFVRTLRACMDADRSKKYIIAAAPQCPFPDHYLGPAPGKAFTDAATCFDEIYIQFYNNYCHTGDAKQFYPNLRQWLDYSAKTKGPQIYVGVPSHEAAAFGRGYWRTPSEMAIIYNKIRHEPRFGGFMLWDASFDQNNVIGRLRYSQHLGRILGNGGNGGGHWTTQRPQPTKTMRPQPETTRPPKPTTTKRPAPTKPSKVSCAGMADGIYAHPTDCSKYFECYLEQLFLKQCPSGLKFNAERKYCDWPANVKC